MTFDPTLLLMQLQSLAAGYGPWGLLAAAGIGIYLRYRKPSNPINVPAPEPVGPVSPVSPTPSDRPILDWIMKLLGAQAAERFPDMPPKDALNRHLVEQAHFGYFAAEATKEPTKPTV